MRAVTPYSIVLLVMSEFWQSGSSPGLVFTQPAHNTNDALSRLAESIAAKYYLDHHHPCVVLISETGLIQNFNALNTALFRISSNDLCSDNDALEAMVMVFEEMCYTFIVQIREPQCFFTLWLAAQWKTIQRLQPDVLFLPVYPAPTTTSDVVFSLRESDYSSRIIAVDIATNDAGWPFHIFGGNFYERVESPNRNPKILLDKWSEAKSFQLNTNLLPDFVSNLRNKTLKVMTFDFDPFSHFEPLDGTEIKLIQEFCNRHNCNLVGVDDGHYWGDIFANGTSNGLAGMVFDGRADFGAAAVYLWLPYFYHIDYSTSYLYSACTLLVPKPHPLGPWKTPFMPFDVYTWLLYGLSVLMAAICMYIITALTIKYTRFAEEIRKRRMFLDKLDCVFRALGLAVLQQPNTPLVPHTPIRHLFTSFEFLFLITSSIYCAELASYLTVPRYTKPIDTLVEFADSGMLWIGEHESWTYSLREMPDPEVITIVQNYRIYSAEKLKALGETGEYGIIVERHGGHYSEQEHLTDKVIGQSHMMAENLFGSPPVIVLRKGSPYKKYFNRVISEALRSGLYLYWEGEMSRKYLHSRKQLALREAEHPHYKDIPRRLALPHMHGGLYLFGTGIAISSIVFIVELLIHRSKQPPR